MKSLSAALLALFFVAPKAAFDTSQSESDAAVAIAYAQLIELPESKDTPREKPPAKPAEPKPQLPEEVIYGGHRFRKLDDGGWEYLDRDGVWQIHPGNKSAPEPQYRIRGLLRW